MMLGFTMLANSWSCRRLGLDVGFVLVQTSWSYRRLGLDPWKCQQVLGTWDARYLMDTFEL